MEGVQLKSFFMDLHTAVKFESRAAVVKFLQPFVQFGSRQWRV